MTGRRENKIADAVCRGTELIAALMECGPVNSQQASLIIRAAVKAAVPNAEFWEICAVAREMVVDFDLKKANETSDEHKTDQIPS